MPPDVAQYGNLPFPEAIALFRQKVTMPSRRWEEYTRGMHSRAFVVAGAVKAELLADLREAVDRAIADGTTITDFRKAFDKTVSRNGWEYKGKRGWRTSTIYSTNLSTAYAAGREQQRRDPSIIKAMPYDRYRTMDDGSVRPLHQSWNNTVLPHDDPWWDDHTPPNGWGCRCWKEAVGRTEYTRLQDADGYRFEAPNDGEFAWKNPATGVTEKVPNGIDPGWNYNPADAAWGRSTARRLIDKSAVGKWVDVDQMSYIDYGRPDVVPVDKPRAKPLRKQATSEAELRDAFKRAVAGDTVFYTNPAGENVAVTSALVDHMLEKPRARMDGRDRYFPLLRETIEDPYEIWVNFAREEATGKIALRQRYIKVLRLSTLKSVVLVTEMQNGYWTGLTFYNSRGDKRVAALRKGRLLYGRE